MTQDEIIKMAREAGFRSGHITLYSCKPLMAGAPIWSQGHRDAIAMLNAMRDVLQSEADRENRNARPF